MSQESNPKKKTFVVFIQEGLGDLLSLPPPEQAPDKYADWGEQDYFKVKTGRGECAA